MEEFQEVRQCETVGKTDRNRTKHETLHNSIMRLDRVLGRLEDLHQRISPVPQDDAKTQGLSGVPSLNEVLEGGSQQIEDFIDRAMSEIERIENLLF